MTTHEQVRLAGRAIKEKRNPSSFRVKTVQGKSFSGHIVGIYGGLTGTTVLDLLDPQSNHVRTFRLKGIVSLDPAPSPTA
jgi:hypothetical protein